MDGWVDGWMDGWMDGWIDGWMGGWMDGYMYGNEMIAAMLTIYKMECSDCYSSLFFFG